MQESKFCPKCQTEKDSSNFNKSKRRDGLRSWCRACEREYSKAKLETLRTQVYDKLGHVCCRCGFDDKRALQIDHVFGGGNQEHSKIKNNCAFLRKVLEDLNGEYQILCANCNWIKRYERTEVVKNYKLSEEGRKNISEARSSWVPTDDQRQRMVSSHIGQQLTESQLERRGKAIAESWKDPNIRQVRINGMTGKKWTDEQREAFRDVATRREASKREKRLAMQTPSV